MTKQIAHRPGSPRLRSTRNRRATAAAPSILSLCPPPSPGELPDPGGHHDPILIIDDDLQTRRMFARILAEDGSEIDLAASARAAVDRVGRRRFSLALCDVQLEGGLGVELACELKRLQPDLGVLMVSDDDDPVMAAAAAQRGNVFSYLVKPFTPNELRINVANTLLRCRVERSTAANEERLRQAVEERTQELSQAVTSLLASRQATIRHLSKAVEMRDPTTHAHIDRIGEISALLARAVGWSEQEIELLRVAAPMHDVGKIGIPDRILLKPGPLTPRERREMERHTAIGHEILAGSDSGLLNLAATIALTHHERVDGGGYPHRLRSEEIPSAGRIVAVADVFDALINDRVYRAALPLDRAITILKEGRGKHFDADILEALFDQLDAVLEIQSSRPGPLPAPGPELVSAFDRGSERGAGV